MFPNMFGKSAKFIFFSCRILREETENIDEWKIQNGSQENWDIVYLRICELLKKRMMMNTVTPTSWVSFKKQKLQQKDINWLPT